MNKIRKSPGLVAYLLIIAIFTIVAFNLNEDIKENCNYTNQDIIHDNQVIETIVSVAEKYGTGTKAEIEARIQSYKDARTPLKHC